MQSLQRIAIWSGVSIAAIAGGIGIAVLTDNSDDPAITACETALKASLKSPKSYERVNAKLNGNTVVVNYDAVNSFNAPIRGKKTCAFDLDKNGRFTFTLPGEAVSELQAIRAKFRDLDHTKVKKEDIEQYQKQIDDIEKTAMNNGIGTMQDILFLQGKDWFPIDPKKTKLTIVN